MMQPVPLIRAVGARPFIVFLRGTGAPVQSLWSRAGLPPRALDEPEALVSLPLAVRFTELGAASQGIENLGFLAAGRLDVRALGAFGAAIARAPTLYQALLAMQASAPAYTSGIRYWFACEQSFVRLCAQFSIRESLHRQADLNTLVFMSGVVRAAAGQDWRPTEIAFQSRGPRSYANVDLFSEARVQSGRRVTSIRFPRFLLSRALEWPTPASPASVAQDAWLASAPPAGFLASVDVLVRSLLDEGHADVGSAADAAGVPLRTFQRRLAQGGTSYSRLVERARFERARRLLADDSIRIVDIALALGYSDHAHFTRAFRRWTSVSPAAYRLACLRKRDLGRDLGA